MTLGLTVQSGSCQVIISGLLVCYIDGTENFPHIFFDNMLKIELSEVDKSNNIIVYG